MYWKILERGENGANSYFSRNRLQKLSPQIDQHPAWMPENSPPSGQAATCWKTKVIQSYLRIWGTYILIGSDPSDSKKWGLYGCSVKKGDFRAGGHWEKLRNSETKSLKIDPKVPNRRYRQGLQKSHWQNPGSYSKKQIFGPKSGPVAGKRLAQRPKGHLLEN